MKPTMWAGLGIVVVAAVFGVRPIGYQTMAAQGGGTAARPIPQFQVDPTWPKLPSKWVLGLVSNVAVDARDHIWILQRPNTAPKGMAAPPVLVFDQSGKQLDVWDDLIVPMSLCINADDEIWVCGSSPQHWKDEEKWLGSPPVDQLFMKFNTDGKLLQLFAPALWVTEKPGTGFKYHQISVDSKGNIYAGDLPGHRIQKFVPVKGERR
jgi:hypothetical protein